MADSYWDGGRRRRQPRGGAATAGPWFAWLERIIIVVATMVLAYGFWIGFTESVEQGAVYAVPASLVLLAAVWRRGVFELPWFP